MDGTSVYQGGCSIYRKPLLDLSLLQLGIIFTATLYRNATVPEVLLLVIVLAQAGIPEAGLALIFAIDRPLDMCYHC